MAEEHAARESHHVGSHLGALLNGRVLLICFIYFLNTLVTYGVFLWLPRILREASGYRGASLSAITSIPFVVALVGMVLIGRHSDRTRERKWHVAACALTGATGLLLAAAAGNNVTLIVMSFALSQLGQRSVQGVFWAIPPIFLGGTAAAAGIALINSVGNLGGFVGPTAMGWLRGMSGSYAPGLLVLAALILEAVLALRRFEEAEAGNGRYTRTRRKRRQNGNTRFEFAWAPGRIPVRAANRARLRQEAPNPHCSVLSPFSPCSPCYRPFPPSPHLRELLRS